MIHVADVKLAAGLLDLCVAAHAKIRVAFDEHLLVDRTVWTMADDAALAHRRMHKDEWSGLVAMALRTAFVLPCHGQSARRFENIAAVRVMALDTVHMPFDNGMMMRQVEFCVDVEMTLKTGRRVLARVDDKISTATRLNVFAARPVTGFTAGLVNHCRVARMNPRVRTAGKFLGDFFVAIRAGLVADIMRPGYFQRCRQRARRGIARNDKQRGTH